MFQLRFLSFVAYIKYCTFIFLGKLIIYFIALKQTCFIFLFHCYFWQFFIFPQDNDWTIVECFDWGISIFLQLCKHFLFFFIFAIWIRHENERIHLHFDAIGNSVQPYLFLIFGCLDHCLVHFLLWIVLQPLFIPFHWKFDQIVVFLFLAALYSTFNYCKIQFATIFDWCEHSDNITLWFDIATVGCVQNVWILVFFFLKVDWSYFEEINLQSLSVILAWKYALFSRRVNFFPDKLSLLVS